MRRGDVEVNILVDEDGIVHSRTVVDDRSSMWELGNSTGRPVPDCDWFQKGLNDKRHLHMSNWRLDLRPEDITCVMCLGTRREGKPR